MTSPLDEKGLAAARLAYKNADYPGKSLSDAIRAYLAVSQPIGERVEAVAWECTDLIMGGDPSVITDVDHAAMRKLQPQAWAVEELVRASKAQSALAAMRAKLDQWDAWAEGMTPSQLDAGMRNLAAKAKENRERAETAEAQVKRLTEALSGLEFSCDILASTRSAETYRRMIDVDKASEALSALDAARRNARATLNNREKADAPSE